MLHRVVLAAALLVGLAACGSAATSAPTTSIPRRTTTEPPSTEPPSTPKPTPSPTLEIRPFGPGVSTTAKVKGRSTVPVTTGTVPLPTLPAGLDSTTVPDVSAPTTLVPALVDITSPLLFGFDFVLGEIRNNPTESSKLAPDVASMVQATGASWSPEQLVGLAITYCNVGPPPPDSSDSTKASWAKVAAVPLKLPEAAVLTAIETGIWRSWHAHLC